MQSHPHCIGLSRQKGLMYRGTRQKLEQEEYSQYFLQLKGR